MDINPPIVDINFKINPMNPRLIYISIYIYMYIYIYIHVQIPSVLILNYALYPDDVH